MSYKTEKYRRRKGKWEGVYNAGREMSVKEEDVKKIQEESEGECRKGEGNVKGESEGRIKERIESEKR